MVFVSGAALCVALACPSARAADEGEHAFVGVKKCKMCHKKPEQGEQFRIWEEGPHAKAYASLASDEAKEKAAELGIENPQTAAECLKCHLTAFPVMDDIANQKITLEEGVSCESCHGAGGDYYKKKTMEGITAGEIEAASVGLTIPDEKTCTQCHTAEGNPFFKGFDFEEYAAKIAHPIPEEGGSSEGEEDAGNEEG